jgi:hypothetical protein
MLTAHAHTQLFAYPLTPNLHCERDHTSDANLVLQPARCPTWVVDRALFCGMGPTVAGLSYGTSQLAGLASARAPAVMASALACAACCCCVALLCRSTLHRGLLLPLAVLLVVLWFAPSLAACSQLSLISSSTGRSGLPSCSARLAVGWLWPHPSARPCLYTFGCAVGRPAVPSYLYEQACGLPLGI